MDKIIKYNLHLKPVDVKTSLFVSQDKTRLVTVIELENGETESFSREITDYREILRLVKMYGFTKED